jgi:exodeoxyribonuclease V
MILAPQQQEAVSRAQAWYENPDGPQVFRCFGPAGTGKTTIAKMFAKIVEGRVIFACFTGKAAYVLNQKGCYGAMTIHSLIYIPSSKSAAILRELQKEYIESEQRGATPRVLQRLKEAIQEEQENVKRPSFSLNNDSDLKKARLLIVDEVSQVNEIMGKDLESFGVKILVLGDTAQLPPVKGGGYFTNVKPDYLLTEVHRQAKDSPILHLATEVREGRGLQNAKPGMILPKGHLEISDLDRCDQVLVGTHVSRKYINAEMRKFKQYLSDLPVAGDRIICTRNDRETGLLNGSQWMVLDSHPDEYTDYLTLHIKSVDNDTQMVVEAHQGPFLDEEVPYWSIRNAQCFEYAYAMTVHKAQGSQFDSVILIDESHKFPSHQRRAWLYTGITRAARELKIIK